MSDTLWISLIFVISVSFTIVLVLFKPTVSFRIKTKEYLQETYFIGGLIGPVLYLIFGYLPIDRIIPILKGNNSIDSFSILILFFCMVILSIFLDSTGFFQFCAIIAVNKAKGKVSSLFFILYFTVGLLTVFTSNDIIILTFTPFIFYFSKNADINPTPLLFAEFFAANTWSMLFLIGNPTNILLGTTFGITFTDYFKVMALPTIITGFSSLMILYWWFRRDLIVKPISSVSISAENIIKDRFGAIVGVIVLIGTIIAMSLSSTIKIDMWVIALVGALVLIFFIFLRNLFYLIQGIHMKSLKRPLFSDFATIIKRLPWPVIPFVFSLFLSISILDDFRIPYFISQLVQNIAGNSQIVTVMTFGFFSAIMANIVNNIPMSVLFAAILQQFHPSNPILLQMAVYAVIIGSNLGALITPIGALAGIMWMSLLRGRALSLSFQDFVKVGFVHTPVVLFISLSALWLTTIIFI